MIRYLLLVLLFLALYHAVRVLLRSAFQAYHAGEDTGRTSVREMVQDPQCRTYIVKDRAVARRIGGAPVYFCSTACADAYENAHRT
jgi:uncharacterized protein